MYNSIYPININYRKNQYHVNGDKKSDINNSTPESNKQENEQTRTSPYSTNQINISQVLADFRNTIIAINAPEEVKEEVDLYLNLVERESKKEEPSRAIILANLTNASKVSDNYIKQVLKKDSNVVEGWITTMFQQKINLKANPDEVNPDFLLKFPQKAQEKIEARVSAKEEKETKQDPLETTKQVLIEEANQAPIEQAGQEETKQALNKKVKPAVFEEPVQINSAIELSKTDEIKIEEIKPQEVITPFSPLNETDKTARELLVQARKQPKGAQYDTQALNMLNEALGMVTDEGNDNIKAALHLERGRIFDDYDYVDYALRDYVEATKAQDLNLKAQAFYKLANIYDEFKEFPPALKNYLSSVAYSGEADNLNAQAQVLSKIASLYTKQFDLEETINYTDLAIETALDTNNDKTIAKTYSTGAQNYQYLGENRRALENYKNALKAFSRDDESYEQMAFNYEQAARTMEKLGNTAKAAKLQLRANQYYQKAQLLQLQLEEVS